MAPEIVQYFIKDNCIGTQIAQDYCQFSNLISGCYYKLKSVKKLGISIFWAFFSLPFSLTYTNFISTGNSLSQWHHKCPVSYTKNGRDFINEKLLHLSRVCNWDVEAPVLNWQNKS